MHIFTYTHKQRTHIFFGEIFIYILCINMSLCSFVMHVRKIKHKAVEFGWRVWVLGAVAGISHASAHIIQTITSACRHTYVRTMREILEYIQYIRAPSQGWNSNILHSYQLWHELNTMLRLIIPPQFGVFVLDWLNVAKMHAWHSPFYPLRWFTAMQTPLPRSFFVVLLALCHNFGFNRSVCWSEFIAQK